MGFFNLFKRKDAPPLEPVRAKRQTPRWKISAPAKIKWEVSLDYIPCVVEDLNMKGLCLSLSEGIPEGCLSAKLYFNERFFFEIEFIVIWHQEINHKQCYGLKFSRFREADKEKLFLMIREDYSSHLQDL